MTELPVPASAAGNDAWTSPIVRAGQELCESAGPVMPDQEHLLSSVGVIRVASGLVAFGDPV
jgi:hypothetical protein